MHTMYIGGPLNFVLIEAAHVVERLHEKQEAGMKASTHADNEEEMKEEEERKQRRGRRRKASSQGDHTRDQDRGDGRQADTRSKHTSADHSTSSSSKPPMS